MDASFADPDDYSPNSSAHDWDSESSSDVELSRAIRQKQASQLKKKKERQKKYRQRLKTDPSLADKLSHLREKER